MKKSFYLIILISFLITSCSSDNENISEEKINPTIADISITEITGSSALLSWTASIPNGTDLSFDIFLENEKIGDNISKSPWAIENLEELTSYSGKIIATSTTGETSEKTFDFTSTENPSPSSFEISITDIATKSAKVSWTEAAIDDNSDILYDIYLNDNLKQENVSGISLLLDELTPFEDYSLKIIAKSSTGKTSYSEKTFKTLGTPPSNFPLTIGDENDVWNNLDPHWLIISWNPPTVEDGSDYYYSIYLNDVLVFDNIINTSNAKTFTDLEEGKTYTVKVVAAALNETVTEESITFTTMTHPELTDFDIQIDASDTSAIINWTSSTDPDGAAVKYHVYLNGEYLGTPSYRSYSFDNLTPNTTYTAKIVAEKGISHPAKKLEKEISFTTDYTEHPTLLVLEAALYTPDSQYFHEQLIVQFSDNIENMRITHFSAGGITIGNYSTYPSAISSGIFSSNDYTTINSNKKGYVLITDNGETYRLNYDIVEKTN